MPSGLPWLSLWRLDYNKVHVGLKGPLSCSGSSVLGPRGCGIRSLGFPKGRGRGELPSLPYSGNDGGTTLTGVWRMATWFLL
jgi:hypothetical protein